MRVSSSNLALRFYLRDGWTKELLDSLVLSGEFVKCSHWEKELKLGVAYYLPDVGTKLDVDKLMGYMTSLHRAFDDYPERSNSVDFIVEDDGKIHESDREFIERMLW